MGFYDVVQSINLFGEDLIRDDKGDLGMLSYRNRKHHRYRGRRAPHHPSNFHHYQAGTGLVIASYFLAPLALAMDMMSEE